MSLLPEVEKVSLKPEPIGLIPEETARVTHAAFPKGTTYTRLRDELGVVWEDEGFAASSRHGGNRPWRRVGLRWSP